MNLLLMKNYGTTSCHVRPLELMGAFFSIDYVCLMLFLVDNLISFCLDYNEHDTRAYL